MSLLELPELVDLRRTASQKRWNPATRSGILTGRTRDWQAITGITLHQTACEMGERPARYETVGAHVCVTSGGQRIWLHDLTKEVVHGNGWNTRCVGVELEGIYEGLAGEISTVWDDPSTRHREQASPVTPEMIAASWETIRWICREVARHGGEVGALVSHRQSSDTRRHDPGEIIWREIALPMMAELGLSDGGVGFCLSGGRPNPEAWDPSRKGIKY